MQLADWTTGKKKSEKAYCIDEVWTIIVTICQWWSWYGRSNRNRGNGWTSIKSILAGKKKEYSNLKISFK